jgi:DNA-binding HxlR family transcriptional regulator
MRKQKHKTYIACPVEATLDLIGGKWKGVVLFHLMQGTKRFNELRRLVPDITQRMLTLQLRQLEKDALLKRKIYNQIPPKVEYTLSSLGETLIPILQQLEQWGSKYALKNRRKEQKNLVQEKIDIV